MDAERDVVVDIEDVTFSYRDSPAIENVTMRVYKGEFVAVMGPNGSGKTTLLRVIAGMVKPQKGRVSVKGVVGYMPQKEHVNYSMPVRVWDIVSMYLLAKKRSFSAMSGLSEEERDRVKRALEDVGMLDYANSPFTALSGGQQQRVLLARALAIKPDVLLLDEPFNGVDLPTQERIIELLSDLSKRGVTIITVVHNVSPMIHHVSRVALLNRKLIAFGKPEEVLTAENTLKAYGVVIPVTVCEEGFLHPLFGDIHG